MRDFTCDRATTCACVSLPEAGEGSGFLGVQGEIHFARSLGKREGRAREGMACALRDSAYPRLSPCDDGRVPRSITTVFLAFIFLSSNEIA